MEEAHNELEQSNLKINEELALRSDQQAKDLQQFISHSMQAIENDREDEV